MCVICKNENYCPFSFELSAHDQGAQWADNSKTNKAMGFILAHDTHFDVELTCKVSLTGGLASELLIRHHLHRRGQIWKEPISKKVLEVLFHISKNKTNGSMIEF